VRGFGLPAVVAINRFPKDTEAELDRLKAFCEERGAAFALSEAFSKGAEGAEELARAVVAAIEGAGTLELTRTYAAEDLAAEKISAVARKIYGADGVEFSDKARAALERFAGWGFGELPVCIAKTQYSLSDDPKKMGAPTGWTLHVTDVALSAGAGFLVVISGAMMLMPGLPKTSRALGIDVDARGAIVGMS
jgi:formate--tetrahydrofolate ligase